MIEFKFERYFLRINDNNHRINGDLYKLNDFFDRINAFSIRINDCRKYALPFLNPIAIYLKYHPRSSRFRSFPSTSC